MFFKNIHARIRVVLLLIIMLFLSYTNGIVKLIMLKYKYQNFNHSRSISKSNGYFR